MSNQLKIKNGLIVENQINSTGITASLYGTSSISISSSYINSASIDGNIISASYALSCSYALNGGGTGISSSYALTSSYASTASLLLGSVSNALIAISSSWASSSYSASYVSGTLTGSLLGTASFAKSASYTITSSYAGTASFFSGSISNATSASYALSASCSSTSSLSFSASSVSASAIGIVPLIAGGTGVIATDNSVASKAVGTYRASVVGGGKSLSDIQIATASFEGQIGEDYGGNKNINIYIAGSTTGGDWFHSVNFPGGVLSIGDSDFADKINSNNNLSVNFNGNPLLWNTNLGGDTLLNSSNWAVSGSGCGVNLSVMTTGSGIVSASIVNGGSGYLIGDNIQLTGSGQVIGQQGNPASLRVLSTGSSGTVTLALLVNLGQYATLPSNNPLTASGGSGNGAIFNYTSSTRLVRALPDNAMSFQHEGAHGYAIQPYGKKLIPGWGYVVFNADPTYNKGFAICSPGISNIDSGNYSFFMCDATNKLFRIPYWATASYQPNDQGWQDTLTISPINGTASFYGSVNINGILRTGISASQGGGRTITNPDGSINTSQAFANGTTGSTQPIRISNVITTQQNISPTGSIAIDIGGGAGVGFHYVGGSGPFDIDVMGNSNILAKWNNPSGNYTQVLGSITAGPGGITGSILGSSSYATTASYAMTAAGTALSSLAFTTTTSSVSMSFNTAGLGTGGSGSLLPNSDDNLQIISFNTGTGAANTLILRITFAVPKSSAPRACFMTDLSGSDAVLIGPARGIYFTNFTTSSYEIWFGSVALTATTPYFIGVMPAQ